jgi:hypothetical protein
MNKKLNKKFIYFLNILKCKNKFYQDSRVKKK